MSAALTQAFQDLTNRYKPNVLEAPLSIYFSLGEEDGQKWTVRLTPEACEVTPGKQDGADVATNRVHGGSLILPIWEDPT